MKTKIRKKFLKIRDSLTLKEQQNASALIQKKILELSEYQKAQTILFYASFRSEVETIDLIQKSLNSQKKVLLPLTFSEKNTMEALEIQDFSRDTQIGYKKILEPKKNCQKIPKTKIDLVIVPAVAFGKKGERLGYGKGFYDRFLQDFQGKIWGIAFDVQITNQIIPEKHDVNMHKIITEKKVIDCKN